MPKNPPPLVAADEPQPNTLTRPEGYSPTKWYQLGYEQQAAIIAELREAGTYEPALFIKEIDR